MKKSYRILVVGESWHGSDCTGLARGFRELGHAVALIGSDQFLPSIVRSFSARLLRKVIAPYFVRQFNNHIVEQRSIIQPNIVLVFKGNNVQTATLDIIQNSGTWLCNFYPDVSFMCHKSLDPEGFSYYHHIFTTKSFGLKDFRDQLGLQNVSYLPHGFDSTVHRPLKSSLPLNKDVDVSFIGSRSLHKQEVLELLASRIGTGSLHIWGEQWVRATKESLLKDSVAGFGIYGDFYALAIGKTKINLGLLSDRAEGASMGDSVTSRTFHIPASGGFLLHERTEEVLEYFEEGKEIACFESPEELLEKVLVLSRE